MVEDLSGFVFFIALIAVFVLLMGVMVFYMLTMDQENTQKAVRNYNCGMLGDPSCTLQEGGKYPKFNPPEEGDD